MSHYFTLHARIIIMVTCGWHYHHLGLVVFGTWSAVSSGASAIHGCWAFRHPRRPGVPGR